MKRTQSAAIVLLFILSTVSSCKKTTYKPANLLSDYYMPMQVGKYAIYQLDSLTFYYYGELDTISHYLAKDSVEEAIIDNSGRPGWRVVRYLSDPAGSQPWTAAETYSVIPTTQRVEVNENNLRYIKLAYPIDEGFTWSGNSFLPYAPFKDQGYDFSDGSHLSLGAWTYAYQHVNKPLTVGNLNYDSTITVLQINDSVNVPIQDPNNFASRSYWEESYARNVGLIYRHTALWEYQPPTPNGSQSGFKVGFEVTLTLLSHN